MALHRSDFEINASDADVWAVLTDLDRYPEWNPALPAISGELREGSVLSMTLALPGRPALNVQANVLEVVPNRRLTWRGHLGADLLFSGYREFAIEPLAADEVRFTHIEDLSGWLAPAFELVMGAPVQRHHVNLNEALKRRAEARAKAH